MPSIYRIKTCPVCNIEHRKRGLYCCQSHANMRDKKTPVIKNKKVPKTNTERSADYVNTLKGRLNRLVIGARRSSKNREQEFNITYDDVLDIWNKQEGKCYYTGWDMTNITSDEKTVSIERIDNNKGYTKDNVLLVCWCANRARNTMLYEEFRSMCIAIAENHKNHVNNSVDNL